MKKRKKFDAKKKRIIDEEHKSLLEQNEKNKKKENTKNSKQNWKMKSEMFRQAMKAGSNDNDSKNNVILVDKKLKTNEIIKDNSNKSNLNNLNNNIGSNNSNINNTNKNLNFNPIQQVSDNTYSDLTPCSFCGRKFNETAFEKHSKICEKNHQLKNIKNNNSKIVKKK